MITSVAVIDGGKLKFEPTEITYRSITYYLDENMLKSMQANAATPSQPVPVNPAPANNASKVNTDVKTVDGQPSTSQPDSKKVSASLPSSTFSSSRMNSATAAEVKTVGVNADPHALLVDLDAEPPSSGPKPILKPVSGGVLNGTALFLPPPIYPDAAKRMRSTGVVTVEVVLDETGKVISAIATSGPTLLRETSMQAALKAKFSPTKLSGQPVKVSGVINYKFSLQ
jgi:TonB family protein